MYSLEESNTQSFCSALPTRFDCIFFTSQTSSEDVSSKNEWLGFFCLLELRKLGKVPNAKIRSFVVSAFNEEKV